MKVLVSAYACSPYLGSEPGMGWNWCVNLASHCELHIITEGEFRDKIEEMVPTLVQGANMHFYYLPVTEKVRRMCWNQGDWRFYYYYRKWQKKTLELARKICEDEAIDILHQLNMIGFREPGYLWEISKETGIPFVWGPIGGLKQFPMQYTEGASWKMKTFMLIKNRLNTWQIKHSWRVGLAMKQASLLISAIPDSNKAIKKHKHLESIIIPETGTIVETYPIANRERFLNDSLTIIWVGKFDFRKRLDLAIKAIATVANRKLMLKVFGTGSKEQEEYAKELSKQVGIEDRIQWMGSCPNKQVIEEMRNADLFLFTSVNEDTSTVVLEAISNRLPVLCFDTCGMSAVITEQVGIKIPLSTPEQSIKDFANRIAYLYDHRNTLVAMSQNCQQRAEELSWENKAKKMMSLYEDVLKNKNNAQTL
jgi:glycosyltransferase involved in cell wall biosynthesis